MSPRLHVRLRRRLRSERGFTLVEVLVAMVAGIIVTGALFAILEISLKQNSRITDRVHAQQLGDVAMTRIVDPLRSGCFARNATPVQEKSTPTKLIFTTAYSESTTPETSEVFKNTVEYSSLNHKLTMTTQKANGGVWPTYTFEASGKTTTLAENIYMPAKKENPFVYYEYGSEAESGLESGLDAMTKLPNQTELSAEQAKTVAGVEVNLEQLPPNKDSRQNRGAPFSDFVTLAFSSPSSEGTIKAGPCE